MPLRFARHLTFHRILRTIVPTVGLILPIAQRTLHADAIDTHPNAEQLKHVFAAPPGEAFKPTGITRADYLKLAAANVDFFKSCQNADGAIIDPISKGERQYSTPAFAVASALLVKEANRSDLLLPATHAMSHALNALISKHAADEHSDFYIPLLVHAYRLLKEVVPQSQADAWAEQFRRINPETMYRSDLRNMNWNIVSDSGELLRRKDGLIAQDQLVPQMKYLVQCLALHLNTYTPLGLVEDPGAPMAYDAFSRLWLEDAFADNAYPAADSDSMQAFLRKGGLSTLLLLSPTGEWPTGGRSSLHNWTDVETLVICEINANYWKTQGRDDVAGAFKRAAHLAFQSVARWQRPSGELWIIKNRAEPQTRLAYEGYSNHSQYNLLPMAMLAIAYTRSDDAIIEKPAPSESGSYVFDARQTFHKIAAAANGYYVLIDTDADPHYNATGLQRVHRAGVSFPTLSDSCAGERAFGPDKAPRAAITPGIEWKSAGGKWISLADFGNEKGKPAVESTDLKVDAEAKDLAFTVIYHLSDDLNQKCDVTEHYVLSADGVTCTSSTKTGIPADRCRVCLPVLVSDGAHDLPVIVTADSVSTDELGSITKINLSPAELSSALTIAGPRIVNHNGYIQEGTAEIKSNSVTWKITLSQSASK